MKLAFAFSAILALTGAACGTNDNSTTNSNGGVTAAQAQNDCNAFLSILCSKVTSCVQGLTMADCLASAKTGADCTKTVGENGELSVCETDLSNSTCAVLVSSDGSNINTPASCMAVFLQPKP